jgi:AmiR/NasT family two-component response regulator
MQNDSRSNGSSNRAADAGLAELHLMQAQVEQLEEVLQSRIVIEQAKGAVSARFGVPVNVAFEMIRGAARSRRQGLHEFCAGIVANGGRLSADGDSTAGDSAD